MHQVLVTGAGKIGSLISLLLANSNDYHVYLADITTDSPHIQRIKAQSPNIELIQMNAQDPDDFAAFLKKAPVKTVISSLPFYCNVAVAQSAKKFGLNYFDLTEDTKTTDAVTELSKGAETAFVPQCGLAPGFISVVSNHLMCHFSTLESVKMRVGALPINSSNALQYSLTWSTDGLINEYGNLCQGIIEGEEVKLLPLDDLEQIKIDGLTYEAFNTSGGIGSLANTYQGRIKELSYKTIRYPGHCDKMRFLMNDLKLNHDRETLKKILENCLPKTYQDVVLVYASVTGLKDNQLMEENYVKKFYSKKINGKIWSAIQLTTASELCSVVDMVLAEPSKYKGLVTHEQFSLDDVTNNRFGQYYA